MNLSVARALTWLVASFGGVILAIVLLGGGTSRNYVVYAHFQDAGDLLPNNFVKIDGTEAGIVQSVSLNRAEDQVIVKMALDSSAAPIGAGASAAVRPVNLLGEKYVQLTTGNLKRPVASGSTIPIGRTSDPVELDDLFNTLDSPTRTGMQLIINEAGLALAGRGADFQQTLADLPPTLGAARRVVAEVAQENTALEHAIVSGNQALGSVVGRRADLQQLIRSGDQALAAVNTARVNLGHTLDTAPGGLAQLRSTLNQLNAASAALTPASVALRQTTPALASTLERLPQFTGEAAGALAEARAVSPLLARLGLRSTPILARLRPTAASLSTFATTLQPFLNTLDQGSGLKEFLGFANGWADVTSQKDSLGHLFRLNFTLDDAFVKNALATYAKLNIPARAPAQRASHRVAPRSGAAGPGFGPAAGAGHPGGLAGVAAGLSGLLGKTAANAAGLLSGVTHNAGALVGGVLGHIAGSRSPQNSQSSASVTGRLLHFLLGS